MEKLKNIKNISKDTIIKIVAAIITVILIAFIIAIKANGETEEEIVVYDYTEVERNLANEVKEYLGKYIALDDAKSGRIADAAVQSYRIIMESGVTDVSDEHTNALEQRMEYALRAEMTEEQATDTGFEALSAGICTIIWNHILEQLDIPETSELDESIQKQIDELKARNMSVKISANIKDHGITEEELASRDASLLEKIGGNLSGIKSEIIKEIETKYGDIEDGKDGRDGRDGQDGTNGKDGANGKNGEKGKDGIDGKKGENGTDGKDGADGKNGINGKDGKDGANGADGEDGKDGINGKDGENGKDGKDGENGLDGKDGADGLSTYYMFSAYPNGRLDGTAEGEISMSAEQSNITKYMGIAHSGEQTAPESPEEYIWTEYKDYIIFSDTDENGVTTVYIQ